MIVSLSEYLAEKLNVEGTTLDESSGPIPFGWYIGTLYTGNPGEGHEKMDFYIYAKKHIRIKALENRGRIWIKSKIIQFWDIPKSKVVFEQLMNELTTRLKTLKLIPDDYDIYRDCKIYFLDKVFDKDLHDIERERKPIVISPKHIDAEYRTLRPEKKVFNFTQFLNENNK